jgi:hypothetical protein
MTAGPFAESPAPKPPPSAGQDWPEGRAPAGVHLGQAVSALLRHGVLSHRFGPHRNYEVRTTLITRRIWQYRSGVFQHGKEMKRAFVPIIIDCADRGQSTRQERGVTEALRLSFAREAVEVHFTRCAAVREYLLLAAVNFPAQPPSGRRYGLLALLFGVALLTGYGLWAHVPWSGSADAPQRGPERPAPVVQGEPYLAVHRPPADPPVQTTPPVVSGEASRDIVAEEASPTHSTHAAESPKTVRLADLLTPTSFPGKSGPATQRPTPPGLPAQTATDVGVGDLLQLTGWIHRISRDADRTYRLQITSRPEAGGPSFVAAVPHPSQVHNSPDLREQLETVRAFILRRLLRQQEPSSRGSVMRRPPLVQLTGQLVSAPSSQGKGPQDTMTHWEMRPVLEIEFATQPEPPDRSRPR